MVAAYGKIALIIGLALIGGGCTVVEHPGPRPDEVVDCADTKNADCIECGWTTGHIACCQHPENCTVINGPTTHGKPNPNQAPKDPQSK
jgi:hypothetical protein